MYSMEEKRILKMYSVNLHKDTVDTLKEKGIELGPFLRQLLDECNETQGPNAIEKKKLEAEQLQRELDKTLMEIKAEEYKKKERINKLNNLPPRIIKFLQDTKEALKKDVRYFEPRRNFFKNYFEIEVTKEEFSQLVEHNKIE